MGLIATLLAGPAVGLFGSLFSSAIKLFEKYQERKQRREDNAHEIVLLKLQQEGRNDEQEHEADIAHVNAQSNMLVASYNHDAAYGPTDRNGAFLLKMVRPTLTLILVLLTGVIYFTVSETQTTGLDPAVTLQDYVVMKILFMTEAAITWWFCDRRLERNQ